MPTLWPTLVLVVLGSICLLWREWRRHAGSAFGAPELARDSKATPDGEAAERPRVLEAVDDRPSSGMAASDPPPAPEARSPEAAPVAWRARLADLAARIRDHATLLVIAALLGLAGVYLWSFSPRPGADIRPGEIGSLFNGLRFTTDLTVINDAYWASIIGVAFSLVAALLLFAARAERVGRETDAPARVEAALLVCALGPLALAQIALFDRYARPNLNFILGVALAAVWAWNYRARLVGDLDRPTWPRSVELVLITSVLGATAFLRLYGLEHIPYGIEGDEAKWVIEVIQAMVYGRYSDLAQMHLYTMPSSFYIQAPFHHWLGPSLYAARFTVAFYSILGSAAFYILVRRLANPQVAFLATLLLAISPYDISASRDAHVETHVKFMPLAALVCLEWATRSDRRLGYALAGVATALALLTYDTVLPLLAVCLLLIVYELLRAHRPLATWVTPLALYLTPTLLVSPILVAYFAGRFSYYGVPRLDGSPDLWSRLIANAGSLFTSIFVTVPFDFFYGRPGPTFNALLLPWLVVGCILAVVAWRRHRMGWWVVFAGLFFLPVPILVGMPVPRVLYPALPAAYALIALALHSGYRDALRATGADGRPVLLALGGFGLAVVVYSNLYIAFNLVPDPIDRQVRREILETARAAAGPDAMVLFPYAPDPSDAIKYEPDHLIWLGMLRPAAEGGGTYLYEVLPLDLVLPALRKLAGRHERIELVWVTGDVAEEPQRQAVLDEIMDCYPDLSAQPPGRFYRRYSLSGAAKPVAECLEGREQPNPASRAR